MPEATTQTRPAHRPGPWTTHYDHPDRSTIAYIRAAGGRMADEIAVCYDVSSDEDRANATLIAAAPELLAALIDLQDAIRRGPPEVIGYDRDGERKRAFDLGWNANADRLWNAAEAARAAIANATGAAS